MRITDIEIPYAGERGKRYRFFEMLPGLLSWTILFLPLILSLINASLAAFFIIGYSLLWLTKTLGQSIRVLQGWRTMQAHVKLEWNDMLDELETGSISAPQAERPRWHYNNLARLQIQPARLKPSELVHGVMIIFSSESYEILQPTVEAITKSKYDMQKVILVLGYEERFAPESQALAMRLKKEYQHAFSEIIMAKHTVLPREIKGKGGNATNAGRALTRYIKEQQIDPLRVVVTTLDSDNRPHPLYLPAVSYTYAACPDPRYISFQPIPIFSNNIWDAPAPMRVIATGNSMWQIIVATRQHILRNFSSHAQSLQTLLDTDFWSVRTIVEDGHQFWRTYFRYDGRHEVYPIFIPIYQDAVLNIGWKRTLKSQFLQLRRWAWGVSDVAYLVDKGFFTDNKIPKIDLTFKLLRLLEGHISWAVEPLILALAAFVPVLVSPQNFTANQLPSVATKLQRLATLGIFVTLYLGFKFLPPKPARYKRRRNIAMVLQWIYLPITRILYASFAAFNAQTRLIFGWYVGEFDITEKAVVTKDNRKVS